jgi:pimeloyl-ACP methyl ester carboxylesterase
VVAMPGSSHGAWHCWIAGWQGRIDGLLTIDLNFRPLLEPLAASRQVIAVELQGHGHTADTGRPMTIEALAGDIVALLDHLGSAEADLFVSASAVSSRTRSRSARPPGSAS